MANDLSFTDETSDVEAIQRAYDTLPYTSNAFAFTHPSRLGALGHVHGLNCALPIRCRVLEIGCASGGNLLPMALGYPASEFVGVDLSSVQIAQARRSAAALSIKNARLIAGDIRELPHDVGTFDYIICHGVYSWVPKAVRESILTTCAMRLAHGGVAMISFNVYPSWHQKDRLRRLLDAALAARGGDALSPVQAVEAAKLWVRQLTTSKTDGSESRWLDSSLRASINEFLNANNEYLFHEYLNRVNQPERTSQFLADAEQHSLRYIADADWGCNGRFARAATQSGVMQIANTRSAQEDLLDDLLDTPFRRAVLCRGEETPAAEPIADRFEQLYAACRFTPSKAAVGTDTDPPQRATTYNVDSYNQTTRLLFPAAADAARALWAASPSYVAVSALHQAAQPHAAICAAAKAARYGLLTLARASAVDLVLAPFPIAAKLGQPLALSAWSRYRVDQGAKYVSGITHEQIHLHESWMKALDGKHGEQRSDALLERISAVCAREEMRLPITNESTAPAGDAASEPADEKAADLHLLRAMTNYGVLQ